MRVNHSIHTIALRREIRLEEVSLWRKVFYDLSERYNTGVYRKSDDEREFYMYAPQGVIINLRAAKNCGYIGVTINLNSLFYREPQRVVLFYLDKYNVLQSGPAEG